MISSTSRQAYERVRESGALTEGMKRIMVWLFKQPEGQSFTRAEIARGTGMMLQSVCARVRDLLDLYPPRLEELPARPCKVTGNPSKPLRVSAAPASASPAEPSAPGKPVPSLTIARALPAVAEPGETAFGLPVIDRGVGHDGVHYVVVRSGA